MKKPRRQVQQEREEKVLRLHLAGYSYREIADIMKISNMGAFKIVKRRLGNKRKNKQK